MGGGVTRGFGYWCWKPQVILQTLQQMNEGDVLFYIDIGCEFQIEGRERLQEMIEEVRENGIMGVQLAGDHSEKMWTKADIFQHFGVLNNKSYTDTKQIAATFIMLCKTQQTENIVQEWLDIFYHHFELVDDSPSLVPNDECFIENRHDQSIWSILNKKYNMINFDGIDFPNKSTNLAQHPIIATRNKVFLNDGILSNLCEQKYALKSITSLLHIFGRFHPLSVTRKAARALKALLLQL